MTNAKDYLNSVRMLNTAIKVKESELYQLKLNIASLSPQTTVERVKSSSSGDIMKTVDKIVDMQAEINAEIDRLVDLKKEVRLKVNQLTDSRYVDILIDYYINCKTWEEVANDLKYNLRWVYRLHDRALQSFSKLM